MPARAIAAHATAALLCGLLAVPALAGAAQPNSGGAAQPNAAAAFAGAAQHNSGGAGQPNPGAAALAPAPSPSQPPATVVSQLGNVTVTAASGGMTLSTGASAMLQRGARFFGTLSPSAAGETVEIERLGHQTDWQWAPTASATVTADGTFTAVWRANHIGRFSIRALIWRPGAPAAAAVAAAAPVVTMTVYRPSVATEYGPGFYGHLTACGERLGRHTIGVANRTLKCGTLVAIYYRGKTMMVPVIDRGPYANHADWDLTEATGRAIGLPGMATIGAVSLPRHPSLL